MKGYEELPGLEHLYLEDSWVLAIEESEAQLRFLIDAVLTEQHPQWRPPKPDEQYCYRRLELTFAQCRAIDWLKRMEGPPAVDASGELDFGHIDVFQWDDSVFELEGDWGRVRVHGERPVVTDLHDARDSPTIQRLLTVLPEFRPVFEEFVAEEGTYASSYLAINEMGRWALPSNDGPLLQRVFTAVDEVYADASLPDGSDLAIEFFESACAAGRDQFEPFIGPASREWFDQHGWKPVRPAGETTKPGASRAS